HLDRIEAGIAPDVEDRLSGKIGRERRFEPGELERGIIPQEMVGRRLHGPDAQIVEPGAERLDPAAHLECVGMALYDLRCHAGTSLMRVTRAPPAPISTVLIDPGSMSNRNMSSRLRPR